MAAKDYVIERLKSLLRDAVNDRKTGASEIRRMRMHGYIDGYMQALKDAGICTKDELTAVIAELRKLGTAKSSQLAES